MVTLLQPKVSGSPGSLVPAGLLPIQPTNITVGHVGAFYNFCSWNEREFQSLVNKKYRDTEITFVELVQEWEDYHWAFDVKETTPEDYVEHARAKVGGLGRSWSTG